MIHHNEMMQHVQTHPFPLLFATLSGAQLYGFPSPDSDFDIRGVHLMPLEMAVGLNEQTETIEKDGFYDGLEIDLVTHDTKKFFTLMLKRNGYVLEQLFSPLVVYASPVHDELKAIAAHCITKHHAHHYLGFAATQWKLFQKHSEPRVKPLLYVYRVLLTGIHLMRTGIIEANLMTLNEEHHLPYIQDLITQKLEGPEKGVIHGPDLNFYAQEYIRLTQKLEAEHQKSTLPDVPAAHEALNTLLVRLRLDGVHA